MAKGNKRNCQPPGSKEKGGAQLMSATCDLGQATRAAGTALAPREKRVYIAGEGKDWKAGS